MATLNIVAGGEVELPGQHRHSWSTAELDLNSSGFNFAANAILPLAQQKDTASSNVQSILHHILGQRENASVVFPSYDVGGLLYPYHDSMNCSIPTAPLSLCLHCGAYLNPLVEFDNDGKWLCSLCGLSNLGLLNLDHDAHPELQHFHSEYSEHIPYFGTLLSESDNSHLVICLSPMMCRDETILASIQRYLREAPTGMNVTIVVIGKCLRLLRLGSHTFSPLAIDIVPTLGDGIASLSGLIKKGMYSTTKDVVLENFGVVESVLHSSFANHASDSLTCLDQIVAFSKALKEFRPSTRLLKLLLIIDAPLSGGGDQGSKGTRCAVYDSIGRKMLQFGCVVYCIYVGLREGNFCEIDSLVAATGGVLTMSESFNEFHVLSLMQKVMRVANRSLHPHDLSTVEVRCSPNMFLDRITGPMASLDDVASSRQHVAMGQHDSSFLSSVYFDQHHFDVAWRNVNRDINASEMSKGIEEARENLLHHCKNRVSICGVFPTEGVNTMLTFQFRENEGEGQRGYPSLSSVSKMMQIDSSRPEEDHSVKPSEPVIDTRFVVQIITRCYSVGAESPSQSAMSGAYQQSAHSPLFKRHVLKKVTRVWTIPFKVAASKFDFAVNVDSPSWALVVLRGLVADFHEQLLDKFGGSKPAVQSDEDAKMYQELRKCYVEKADSLLKDIAKKWGSHGGKLQDIARAIYHLREGPLLDGPAASPQEAFHMRSIFLKASFTHASRLLTPLVRLDIINLTPSPADSPSTAVKHQPLPLKEMDPDSTSLVPLTVALVDCGNIVVVRRNSTTCSKYATGMDGEAFLFRLKSIGEQICQGRFPPSKFVVINSPGTPVDRLIYSRLSPSHMESKESLLDRISSIPEFQWMTAKDVEELVRDMPPTDQLHFQQYVSLHIGSVSRNSNKEKRPPIISLPHLDATVATSMQPPRVETIERDVYTGLPLPTPSHGDHSQDNLV